MVDWFIILYYIILYYIILYYIILLYILYYIILYCITLYNVILYYILLYHLKFYIENNIYQIIYIKRCMKNVQLTCINEHKKIKIIRLWIIITQELIYIKCDIRYYQLHRISDVQKIHFKKCIKRKQPKHKI